jgi:hypothetical protein
MKRLSLLFLVPLAASAAETCLPVPYDAPSASPPGLSLSADGPWLAAAGKQAVKLFKDPQVLPAASVGGGESVSIRGDRMAVGSPGEGGAGVVRVYQYDPEMDLWELVSPMLEGTRPGARFGASVALGDDWLVVGAPEDGAVREGSAYVYSLNTLRLERVLRPGDVRLADRFGTSVAVDEDTIVVGSPYADDLKVFYNFGAAYVFDAGTGEQKVKLQADAKFRPGDLQFGTSVAIRDGRIVVGAPGDDPSRQESAGSAYLFTRDNGTWSKQADLIPRDSSPSPGRQLGISVAIDEDRIAVGAIGDGAAYFFALDGTPAGRCGCGSHYGRSVALWNRGRGHEVFLGEAGGVKGCFEIIEPPQPDLMCEFKNAPAAVPAGGTATYTIQVRNKGTGPAEPARLVVVTPSKLSDGICTPAGCSAPILPGESRKFRVTFTLPPACMSPPASIQPRASVWSGTTETACSLPPPTRIERPFGVQGKIEGDGQSVLSGKELTYHLRLENHGPGLAPDGAGHELEHTLPPDLVLVASKVVAGGGTLKEPDKPSGDPTESLEWDGAIPLCGTVDIQVTARVPYDQGQVEETICLEATVKDRAGRSRPATPYCFRVIPYPEITPPSGGR